MYNHNTNIHNTLKTQKELRNVRQISFFFPFFKEIKKHFTFLFWSEQEMKIKMKELAIQ